MFLPTYVVNSSMTLPKYQANEDYGYIIDILDHEEEANICHIDNLYDKSNIQMKVSSPYSSSPQYLMDDQVLVFVEEGRAQESYMTKAKKTCSECSEFIRKLWK